MAPFLEQFTHEECEALRPYFTNVDRPVFALTNLPEVVKGALFARYSRSAKSLRRLFLDEFHEDIATSDVAVGVGVDRAEKLYEKVFLEYGDDSVAQLGGVHLACESVSNVLTKILEWGRLMAYLEQSTRYVPYTDRPGGDWKYRVPPELEGTPLESTYRGALDAAFETYTRWMEPMEAWFRRLHPRADGTPAGAYRRTLRAKALDTLRGLLPASTLANVGIYGTGQAYEMLLLRMRAHPLAEVREYSDLMLEELRKVIPAFLRRVDLPERGEVWSRYLAETREAIHALSREIGAGETRSAEPEVALVDFDPEGERKVAAAALYAGSDLPDRRLLEIARKLDAAGCDRVLRAYNGDRRNRRHRPGRAFERTSYRFDVLADYGAFRDLQRHRMLTLEWQQLSPAHGYNIAEAIEEAGAGDDWRRVMQRCAEAHDAIVDAGLGQVAPYVIPMAYRVRFYMEMNARESMHVIELRTAPQGHASYRRVCQKMHDQIAEVAGHRTIAGCIRFANHEDVELERLEAESAAERKRGSS